MAASPLGAFITWLYDVFVFLLNLTIDLLATCLLVPVAATFWRWPFVVAALAKACSKSRGDYRAACGVQLCFSLLEASSLLLLPIPLLSGLRSVQCCRSLARAKSSWDDRNICNWERCWSVWSSFVDLIVDILVLLFTLLTAVASLPIIVSWRAPTVCQPPGRCARRWRRRPFQNALLHHTTRSWSSACPKSCWSRTTGTM